MAFNMNQFSQTPATGQLDLVVGNNPSVFTLRVDPDSVATAAELVPGAGVKLVDGGADDPLGVPLVDERTADGDAIFGVILYNTKSNSYAAGDTLEVGARGSVVVLNSGAAIARGDSVALVLATPGNVVTRTTETILGTALDKATAANQPVRVLLA